MSLITRGRHGNQARTRLIVVGVVAGTLACLAALGMARDDRSTMIVRSSTSPTPSVAVASSMAGGRRLTLVTFGTSWTSGASCAECRPAPTLYADALAAMVEGTVDHRSLGLGMGGDAGLASTGRALERNTDVRRTVASADVVVVLTSLTDLGDIPEWIINGRCDNPGQVRCLRLIDIQTRFELEHVVALIDGLRAGRPMAIRVLTAPNRFLDDPASIGRLGAGFGRTYGVAVVRTFRDLTCDVAAQNHAVCVDLGSVLNGAGLLHPADMNRQDTMQAIADALKASGLGELDP